MLRLSKSPAARLASGQAAREPCPRRDRPRRAAMPGNRAVSRRAAARPVRHDAADRTRRLLAARSVAQRASAAHRDRRHGLELGPSLEQGDHPRRARRAVRVERDPEAGGDPPASFSRGPHRGHRCAVLRPLVRAGADAVPSRVRRHAGLPDERPVRAVGLLGAAPRDPPEPSVVLRWASHLRRSNDPRIRDVPILLRPHPSRTAEWAGVDWRSVGNVAMFGGAPVDDHGREDYFESLHYSAAVVGITTSAFLEAAVVGRPVMSFASEDLRPEHEGSLHFQHLVDAEHGLLTMAASLEEHGRQLASVLDRTADRSWRGSGGSSTPSSAPVAWRCPRRTWSPSRSNASVEASGWARIRAFALWADWAVHTRDVDRDEHWRSLILDEREGEREARLSERTRIRAEELARKRADKAAGWLRSAGECGPARESSVLSAWFAQ